MTSATKFEEVDTTQEPQNNPKGNKMTTEIKWIDEQPGYTVGDAGFLIEVSNENTASSRFSLDDKPPYTNQSNMPRLVGWCGSYNNVGTYGCGAWRVVREAKNGRLQVQRLTGEDLQGFLEEMGYPDLTDAD